MRGARNRVRVIQGSGLGDLLDLGGGYSAKIIAGSGYVLDRDTRVEHVNNSENARSVVVLVSGPEKFEFLIPGDASGQQSGDEHAVIAAQANPAGMRALEITLLAANQAAALAQRLNELGGRAF